MTLDLFESPPEAPSFERIPMRDAEVLYAPTVPLPCSSELLLHQLIDEVPWRSEKITVWGRTFDQPRLVAWFGDPGRSYTYSGIQLQPLPWTPVLRQVKNAVEGYTGEAFNSVLLNLYRNERDSMGFHSDDEKELGPTPAIASISLGAERTFVMKHKTATDLRPVRFRLASGSLLLMKGLTQKHWKHGIDKESKPCGPRINLTFRRIFL